MRRLAPLILVAFTACARQVHDQATTPEQASRLLGVLAHDSMEGRFTGSRGGAAAARFIAAELERAGLQPAGDSGWFQRVPAANGGVNVVGVLPGSDPALAAEVVVIDAHYDHIGVAGRGNCIAQGADSICNGADDDASGTVAVLETARQLAAARPGPKRTVVFLLVTGEEVGTLGSRWYLDHPVRPIEKTVANLEIEMIGRPDPKTEAGGTGRGRAWLTGYDRSSMGQILRDNGIPIVADPYPEMNFFERSDNIIFAYRGVPAHTISSFNLHEDYHRPSDEAGRADAAHMAAVINAIARAARILADGPAPQWAPGGRPSSGH